LLPRSPREGGKLTSWHRRYPVQGKGGGERGFYTNEKGRSGSAPSNQQLDSSWGKKKERKGGARICRSTVAKKKQACAGLFAAIETFGGKKKRKKKGKKGGGRGPHGLGVFSKEMRRPPCTPPYPSNKEREEKGRGLGNHPEEISQKERKAITLLTLSTTLPERGEEKERGKKKFLQAFFLGGEGGAGRPFASILKILCNRILSARKRKKREGDI